MPIDVEHAREVTPGCAKVCHLNNAGAALPPLPVIDAVIDYLRLEAETGGYEAAGGRRRGDRRRVRQRCDAARRPVARDRTGRERDHRLERRLPLRPVPARRSGGHRPHRVREQRHQPAQIAKARYGVEIVLVDDDEHGQISLDVLRERLDERARSSRSPTSPRAAGSSTPPPRSGAIAREAGVLYLLDACQSVGQMPIDVDALGCDLLSARPGASSCAGHAGTGFLYVPTRVLDAAASRLSLDIRVGGLDCAGQLRDRAGRAPLRDVGGQHRRPARPRGRRRVRARRSGSTTIARAHAVLADGSARSSLADRRVTVHDKGVRAVRHRDLRGRRRDPPSRCAGGLRRATINTSVTDAQLALFDFPGAASTELVRASPHYYNTEDRDRSLDRGRVILCPCRHFVSRTRSRG